MLKSLCQKLASKTKYLLLILLSMSFLIRVFHLDYPKTFVFDEVYYPFTAQQYLNGNKSAWEFGAKAPEGHAYAWVNPPLAQEIMALSMLIFHTQSSWSFRLPGVILGTLSIYFVFLIARLLFKNDTIALLSAAIFSLDGLNFVLSRTAMLDIYLVTFILISLYFFLSCRFFYSAIFLGLALSTKWTALYILPFYFVILVKFGPLKKSIYFFVLIPLIYLLIYTPFFLTGHSLKLFIETLKQEWWYHTHLNATHPYSSSWWSWPLNLYPVWYFVDYQKDLMANIFASGNPAVFWLGSLSLIKTAWDFLFSKAHPKSLWIIIFAFLLFWLPWALSPRIMFLYYFGPAIPFLCLSLGFQLYNLYQVKRTKELAIFAFFLIIFFFLLIYPFLTGVYLPKSYITLFFHTNITKNPF